MRLFLKNTSQPRFLLAFLNFGTAILLEATPIHNSNIAQQFTRIGDAGEIAHLMAVYFLLAANIAVLPVISDRIPDLMKHWWGVALAVSPVAVYSLFGVLSAIHLGVVLPIWWVGWVVVLLTVIFARGWK